MYVFEVLGSILGELTDGGYMLANNTYKTINDDTISKILSLCDDVEKADEFYRVIENGKWYAAMVRFDRNPQGKAEVASITLKNSKGDSVSCDVAEGVLAYLTEERVDDTYFAMCEGIMNKLGREMMV